MNSVTFIFNFNPVLIPFDVSFDQCISSAIYACQGINVCITEFEIIGQEVDFKKIVFGYKFAHL